MKIDDGLEGTRWLGRPPRLTGSELICPAVAQVLLGFHSEARWIRFAHTHLRAMFLYLPKRPGCNKCSKAALPLVKRMIQALVTDTACWFDNVWGTDSAPVECGRSRPTRLWITIGAGPGVPRSEPGLLGGPDRAYQEG
ncbi:hypothetical protein ACFFNX_30175 [Actinoallomurus acaciae]|uniref:Transposase n=1 Tax=Actinoallomurus acaciae TaxID=502577 RepID=A0ABV5YP76_9ACTN